MLETWCSWNDNIYKQLICHPIWSQTLSNKLQSAKPSINAHIMLHASISSESHTTNLNNSNGPCFDSFRLRRGSRITMPTFLAFVECICPVYGPNGSFSIFHGCHKQQWMGVTSIQLCMCLGILRGAGIFKAVSNLCRAHEAKDYRWIKAHAYPSVRGRQRLADCFSRNIRYVPGNSEVH